jgi:hypothetical protein
MTYTTNMVGTSTRSRLKYFFAALALAALIFFAYTLLSSNTFRGAFETYAPLAEAHVDAAYIPGVPDNPIRQRLNSILSQVLARPMTPKERIALAEEGLAVLKEGEKQIDAIGEAGERVQIAITYMEDKKNSVGAVFSKSQANEIIALAKEEFGIVADIRGLSYRANFHTAEIFNRIILDKGELTAGYTQELNDQIPAVEEQFNKRTHLYDQLKAVAARLQKASAAL